MSKLLGKKSSEGWIIAIISAVQFVNVLDFMMVMPLGPDFARGLGIPNSELGLVGGSYTAAGAVAGVLGSTFLDQFDRRKALLLAMLGLALGTLAGGFAVDLTTLVAARIVAGLFGGPATSLSLSIVADTVPSIRRGRAMGAVMGAFSLASIFGVPAGLELATIGGWRTPFFAVAALCLVITALVMILLPPMAGHLRGGAAASDEGGPRDKAMLLRPEVLSAYASVGFSMLGAFMMIPNFSAYFQFNLGYPRSRLGLLYLIGGAASFVIMRIAGRAVDRFGSATVGAVGSFSLMCFNFVGYYLFPPLLPPLLIFTGYMVSMSIRGVAVSSLSSRVPRMRERARFMSFQSAVQHIASAIGAFASTRILSENSKGALVGMPRLVLISIGITALAPVFMFVVERRVRVTESVLTHIP